MILSGWALIVTPIPIFFERREEKNMENKIKLNVYNEKDDVVKTVEAKIIELRFGTIRSLMELLNVENIDDTSDLLKTVYGAWDSLTNILGRVFPDMTDEDWENIKLSELIPVILMILKDSFVQILAIPTDSKNSKAE